MAEKKKTSKKITLTHYATLQNGYDYFNLRLFGSTLPGCLITMQRKNSCCGYFSKNRFESRGKRQSKISVVKTSRGSIRSSKPRQVNKSRPGIRALKRQIVRESRCSVSSGTHTSKRRTVKISGHQRDLASKSKQRNGKQTFGININVLNQKSRGRNLKSVKVWTIKIKKSHIDEIALNPDTFVRQTDKEILSTLVHEMVHQWQFVYGKPGRGRYHNRQWADKMESIGLMPSDTGQPGGKRTGQNMSDYIIQGSNFDRACDVFFRQYKGINWQSYSIPKLKTRRKSKVKYECPVCGQKCWAKPEANFICGDCKVVMIEH